MDAHAELAESPWWDARLRRLFWVDILKGQVHMFDPLNADDTIFDVGQPVGATAPRLGGGLVLALRDGVAFLNIDTGDVTPAFAIESELTENRMNDGRCDPRGRFWVGTMALDSSPQAGSLYCLGGDGQLRRVLRGVSVSNGIDWSPDGRTMYYVDTPTQRVDAFDFDLERGLISNRRPVVRLSGRCFADGMTVDAEGYLWVAVWGSWSVQRFSPDGMLERLVSLPVEQVTSCAFGGEDFRDLYVTSANKDLSDRDQLEQPRAGGIFRVRAGVQGTPPHAFAG